MRLFFLVFCPKQLQDVNNSNLNSLNNDVHSYHHWYHLKIKFAQFIKFHSTVDPKSYTIYMVRRSSTKSLLCSSMSLNIDVAMPISLRAPRTNTSKYSGMIKYASDF